MKLSPGAQARVDAARARRAEREAELRAIAAQRDAERQAAAQAENTAPGESAPSSDDATDGYEVGYGKPPLHTRFKKGEKSPAEDGGWPTKRRKKAERQEAERLMQIRQEEARKKRAEEIPKRLKAYLQRDVTVVINGTTETVSAMERQMMHLEQKSFTDDKSQTKLLKLAKDLGVFDKPSEKQQVGVVVVTPPTMSKEAWLKKARATKLPLDPLEGLPGIDPGALDRVRGRTGKTAEGGQDED